MSTIIVRVFTNQIDNGLVKRKFDLLLDQKQQENLYEELQQ